MIGYLALAAVAGVILWYVCTLIRTDGPPTTSPAADQAPNGGRLPTDPLDWYMSSGSTPSPFALALLTSAQGSNRDELDECDAVQEMRDDQIRDDMDDEPDFGYYDDDQEAP